MRLGLLGRPVLGQPALSRPFINGRGNPAFLRAKRLMSYCLASSSKRQSMDRLVTFQYLDISVLAQFLFDALQSRIERLDLGAQLIKFPAQFGVFLFQRL